MSRLYNVLDALADTSEIMTSVLSLGSKTIASKGAETLTADASLAGYKPLAVVAISKSGGGSGYVVPTAWYISGGNASATLYNMHTAPVTITASVAILYQKIPS